MLEIMAKENNTAITNPELKKVTTAINKCGANIRNNFYKIAYLLNKVNEERLYIDDGFMSTAEYAEKTFNIKKTLTYNLIAIGMNYTAENGKESNLPHTGNKDYTSSQLKVMLPYDEQDVKKLAENEEISPLMTVTSLKKKLKEELATEHEAQEQEQEQEEDEAVEVEATEIETNESPVPVWLFEIKAYEDGNGETAITTEGEIPEEIAEAITRYLHRINY